MDTAYDMDDWWRLEDGLASAEMQEIDMLGRQPNSSPPGGDAEASQPIRALLERIDILEHAIESQDVAIAKVWDAFGSDGEV